MRPLVRASRTLGFDPQSFISNLLAVPAFIRDWRTYVQDAPHSMRPALRNLYPVLNDARNQAGNLNDHYFRQDLWAAQRIFGAHPTRHIDIGSRIDGFIAHLLVFMPVTVVDLRLLDREVPGLTFVREDATSMAGFADNSVESLSSLHAAEHFGLGRYGDRVDPDSCFAFMRALERVLAPAGRLYFSVPIGKERVEFNAHRVFDVETILNAFPSLTLASFSFIDDAGAFHPDAHPTRVPPSDYACGLFEFHKPPL